MEEKEYILTNQESFELADIFECGQCFRWNIQKDGSYTGVIKDAVINVKKIEDKIIFRGMVKNNLVDFEKLIRDYFDLATNYEEIKSKLAGIDEYLKESTEFGKRY